MESGSERARETTTHRSESIAYGVLIVAAAILAYHGSLSGPFILDDRPHILENPGIRQLWPPSAVLNTTRPLVGLTLAANFAIGGLRVWGYHVLNLALHAAVALALFLLTRVTLMRPGRSSSPGAKAGPLALATALLWVVHPLNTEAVTYVIQRGEVLAGLFTLLTLYGLARHAGARHKRGWEIFVWACCALGLASKPVMAVTPVLALVYDRVFLAASWREAWRERGRLHVGLLALLALLPLFLAQAPIEWRNTAGFTAVGVTPLRYAAAQPFAIARYVRLAFWPDDLCLDYGWPSPRPPAALALALVPILALLAATVAGLWRGHRVAFIGLAFAIPLSLTSSFVPIADPVVEHRMYLPLMAVILAVVLAGDALVRRLGEQLSWPPRTIALMGGSCVLLATVALAGRTIERNRDYATEIAIWSDTVGKRPQQARSHGNLGAALLKCGRTEDAIREFREALRLDPGFIPAHVSLGRVLYRRGELAESRAHLDAALRLDPANLEGRTNLGIVYLLAGHLRDAEEELAWVVRTNPPDAKPYRGLGLAFARMGRDSEAVIQLKRALVRQPGDVAARIDLASAYIRLGLDGRARRELATALDLDPNNAPARMALLRLERR